MGSVAGKNHFGPSYTRRAHHAGSWYEDDEEDLEKTLQGFLDAVKHNSNISNSSSSSSSGRLRALICPHAGYSFSGPTAAYSYAALHRELADKNSPIQRILVLHPSHHVYLDGCAVSGAASIETPLGNLNVDSELRREILNLSSAFTVMNQTADEHEHSGEMQYPFVCKLLNECQRNDVTVLPVMCGALSTSKETFFGELLATIIDRSDVLTIVSTDFCHWGSRFSYRPTPPQTKKSMPIHEFIQQMDQRGMDLIQLQQPGAFAQYLKETRNTICGRHAVAVWLRAVANTDNNFNVQFVRYDQSSAAKSMSDSSVSYAAALATLEDS